MGKNVFRENGTLLSHTFLPVKGADACSKCPGKPTLWILENNLNAARLYQREGFSLTGRRNNIDKGLDEIEFIKE